MKSKKLLIATRNPGKFKEYKIIFNKLLPEINLISLKDLNVKEEVKEDGKTHKENALKKARFYSKLMNLPTLGDDGGLEIDFLDGEPGIKSRRWPGYEATDEELIQIILEKMKDVPFQKRKAKLIAVVVLIFPKDSKTYTFKGVLDGYIAENPIVQRFKGYPFRSVFYLPQEKKVFAELSPEHEAEICHRKIAIKKAMPLLRKKFGIKF